jgi:hypothetical protein
MSSLRPLITCLLRPTLGDRLLAALALAMAGRPEGQPERGAARGSR